MDRRQKEELSVIAGPDGVKTDRTTLGRFFRDPPGSSALTVVSPRDHETLGLAANFAYENDVPMYTHRRGYMDEAIAARDAILFDLEAMKAIRRLDEANLLGFVEYGVTFETMKEELDPLGLRILMPAAATSSSVVRSYVDRDVILANGATRPYQLTIFHAILADGRIWMSGNDQMTPEGHSEFREDIGPMYSYFFHASEDIYGMPVAAKVWLYKRWEERRVTAYGFDSPEEAVKAAYRASRGDQVFECVVADARYLSVLLTDDPGDADALAGELPPWSVVFGFDNHGKLVDIWDRQTAGISADCGGSPAGAELAARMADKFEWPWYVRDRDHYRGDTSLVDYYTFGGKVTELFAEADSRADGLDTGRVAIPSYYGGAFYCETDIYSEPGKAGEAWVEAFKAVLDKGAHVSRPRGEVARIVYGRMGEENIGMMKDLKRVLDPKGLLNPDQLLEGV